MSGIRNRRSWTALLSVLALSMVLVAPASADSAASGHYVAAVAVCQGSAHLDAGLSAPPVTTQANWTFNTECDIVIVTTSGVVQTTGSLSASGTVDGSCGNSTGQGTYEVTLNHNGDVISGDFTWNSAGSVLLVTGDHDAPGPNQGTLAAEMLASPENPDDCLSGDADTFVVNVVAELA